MAVRRAADTPIEVGLVGTGDIMRRGFVPAAQKLDGVRITGVLSGDLDRARALASNVGGVRAYDDLTAFLTQSGVQAIILATPDAAHEKQVREAATAGIHVLCSKPMAPTHAACVRMADAAASAGIVLAMSHPLRSHNAFKRIKDVLESGELGRVRYVRALWTRLRNPTDELWRMDAEQTRFWALGRHGAHLVDLARWLFGEPVEVRAKISNPREGGPNDELAVLLLTFADGLIFELTVSILFAGGNCLEIYGENAVLRASNVFQYSERMLPITIGDHTIEYESNNPFVEQLANFVDAIREGSPLVSPAWDGVRCVEIMERALASSLDNRQRSFAHDIKGEEIFR
jgi:D-xylose 1-dehydrogenase (NADP+, D-xylono-1,5-lactone-forming)